MNVIKQILLFVLCVALIFSLTSCLVEDDEYEDLGNKAENDGGKEDVEDGGVGGKNDVAEGGGVGERSSMSPYVELIEVKDEEFHGFFDLVEKKGNVTEDHMHKGYVDWLVDNGYIVSKLNPSDGKGEYRPDETIKSIEAITMLINAYSAEKINMNDWIRDVCGRMEEDGFPEIFLQKINTDEKKARDYLYGGLRFEDCVMLLEFCYEKYTGKTIRASEADDNGGEYTFAASLPVFNEVLGGKYSNFEENNLILRGVFADMLCEYIKMNGEK